jgi:hypothetical protein
LLKSRWSLVTAVSNLSGAGRFAAGPATRQKLTSQDKNRARVGTHISDEFNPMGDVVPEPSNEGIAE